MTRLTLPWFLVAILALPVTACVTPNQSDDDDDDVSDDDDDSYVPSGPWADLSYAERILFDFVRTIPSSLRLKGFRRRHVQLEAMRDLLPETIYRRSNMGLELPHSLWFQKGLRPLMQQYLEPASIDATGVLKGSAVQRLVQQHDQGVKDHGRSLWCILNFVVWHQLFIQSNDYRQHLSSWQGQPRISRDGPSPPRPGPPPTDG